MDVFTGEILDQLQSLAGRADVSGDEVRFRMALLEAQVISFEELEDSPLAPLPPVVPERPPILRPSDVPFDFALALRLFRSLVEVFRNCGKADPRWEPEITVQRRPHWLQVLIRRVALAGDAGCLNGLTRRMDASAETINFLARLLAAPFVVHELSKVSPEAIAGLQSDGGCPACGSSPGLAWLGTEDGGRWLGCSLCGTSWRFDQPACPFCGHSAGPLDRLEVPDEPDRWIEACPSCRHYVKTVDRRRRIGAERFVPLVEHTGTLHLGRIAQREGYLAGPPYSALW